MIGRPWQFLLSLAGGCLLGLSCAQGPSPSRASALPSPAPSGSSQPNLVSAGGRVYLSWLQQHEDSTSLSIAAYDGASWGETSSVASTGSLLVNWADFPSAIVTDDGEFAATWLVEGAGESFAYDAFMGVSTDGGRSFGAPLRLHDDTVSTEHGFVSLIDEAGGSIGMVWLDGRELALGGTMQLRYRSLVRGVLEPEILLDDDVCTCCQTSAGAIGDDLIVAYRDRGAGEIRDIRVIRRHDGIWDEGRTVHDDGWRIAGCPVNGPALAVNGNDAALAWFTAADERPRVLLAFSDDGGDGFGEPIVVESEGALGRVDLLALDEGAFAVVWMAARDGGAEVLLRRYRTDGGKGPIRVVGAARPGRKSGFPRAARLGTKVYVAWTEPGPSPELRLASLDL